MKFAKFNTLEEAQSKLQELNALAETETSTEPFSLTSVYTSADGSFFWFNYSDCLFNGGYGTSAIANQESQLTIIESENVPDGFLPIQAEFQLQ